MGMASEWRGPTNDYLMSVHVLFGMPRTWSILSTTSPHISVLVTGCIILTTTNNPPLSFFFFEHYCLELAD